MIAIVAWAVCFVVTFAMTFVTKQTKSDADLKGLVYSLTERPKVTGVAWFRRPAPLAGVVLVTTIIINYVLR
jgi:SSS family solute:Na+ symporter